MLKREKRKSPMKPPADLKEKAPSAAEELPSLSGYLEIARQKRSSERRSGISAKASPVPRKPVTEKTSKGASTLPVERESSFARMAREKRAARKGA